MQARSSRIEADVGGDRLLLRERVERGGVGHLVDVAALVEQAQKRGTIGRHVTRLSVMLSTLLLRCDAVHARTPSGDAARQPAVQGLGDRRPYRVARTD